MASCGDEREVNDSVGAEGVEEKRAKMKEERSGAAGSGGYPGSAASSSANDVITRESTVICSDEDLGGPYSNNRKQMVAAGNDDVMAAILPGCDRESGAQNKDNAAAVSGSYQQPNRRCNDLDNDLAAVPGCSRQEEVVARCGEKEILLSNDTGATSPNVENSGSKMAALDPNVPVTYGELIVLGYNGCLKNGDKGRRRSKFRLMRRSAANGVKPTKHHVVKNPQQSQLIQDANQHSVSYTLSRNQAVIVQYDRDADTDMFQLGRSSDAPIDYVVMDTVPGGRGTEQSQSAQSTISRFACRILVSRHPPHTARIYAAGFDVHNNIFLGEKATKWYNHGEIDGLTTNGILVMTPSGGFNATAKPRVWREVSVGGGVYALRESRSTPQKSSLVEKEINVLKDGSLIDLCGATLLWRSAGGLLNSPSKRELEYRVEEINAARPQCPVGLNTLVLPSKSTVTRDKNKQPFVYLNCGHVHGQHDWGQQEEAQGGRICTMCRTTGPFVKLRLGHETSVYVDSEPPTHAFKPCAHMASENTIKYWSSVVIPHGCHGFHAMCPFCATPLEGSPGWVKLIFQDNVD